MTRRVSQTIGAGSGFEWPASPAGSGFAAAVLVALVAAVAAGAIA